MQQITALATSLNNVNKPLKFQAMENHQRAGRNPCALGLAGQQLIVGLKEVSFRVVFPPLYSNCYYRM